jgi:beta-phosphoglucomutase-like phosphatase (HAD superfamily)
VTFGGPSRGTGKTLHVNVDELLVGAELVCFEFEGVVCDETGGRFDVARVLAKLAKRFILPIDVLDSRDTSELLGRLDLYGTEVAESGDNAAADLECEAIEKANLQPGIRSLLTLIRESGRKTACVSRISDRAVRAFLESNQISDTLDSIVTRPTALSHMMPKPHVLYTTLLNLGVRQPEKALLIASSEAACEAADKIKIPVVCYQVRHGQRGSRARSRQTVQDLAALARSLGQVSLDDHEKQLQRVIDLRCKGVLTNAEMLEYLLISGGGKHVGNVSHYGFVDNETARENLWILEHARREAAGRRLVLEVLQALQS